MKKHRKEILRQVKKGEVYVYQVTKPDGELHYSNVPLDHPKLMSVSINEVQWIFEQEEKQL